MDSEDAAAVTFLPISFKFMVGLTYGANERGVGGCGYLIPLGGFGSLRDQWPCHLGKPVRLLSHSRFAQLPCARLAPVPEGSR